MLNGNPQVSLNTCIIKYVVQRSIAKSIGVQRVFLHFLGWIMKAIISNTCGNTVTIVTCNGIYPYRCNPITK